MPFGLSVKDFGDSQGLVFLLLYGKYKLDNLFFLLFMFFPSFQPNLCPILRKTGPSGSSQLCSLPSILPCPPVNGLKMVYEHAWGSNNSGKVKQSKKGKKGKERQN